VSTRRHKKSQARFEQIAVGTVTVFMKEFREHADEARHFLVVSSVHAKLELERDSGDKSLANFQASHNRIEGFIRNKEWQGLCEFVAGFNQQSDIFLANSVTSLEARLLDYHHRFAGFGVGIAYSVAWLAEPKIYYLLLWKD
jgi:hypothetical protein